MRYATSFLFALTLMAQPASAVTLDLVNVGDIGNACETQAGGCYGAVDYAYRIGQREVSNAQYSEFLNAVAADDVNALYNTGMATGIGGIARSGSAGSYAYSVVAGRGDKPVNLVSYYDTLRFANWMHNGQPSGAQGAGTTENGSYTITAQGIAGNSITRNAGATIVLASSDEWYKAAYYQPSVMAYFDYMAGSNTQPACAAAGATANTANCASVVGDLTDGGAYTGSASAYGTFDQGGNLFEWNDGIFFGPPPLDGSDPVPDSRRETRGGSYNGTVAALKSSVRTVRNPNSDYGFIGFRVAVIPEPGTAWLLGGGLVALAMTGRRRRKRYPPRLIGRVPSAIGRCRTYR